MAKRRRSPATKFLWIVAILTMIVIAGAILYRVFQAQLIKWAMVPSAEFKEVPKQAGSSYADANLWISRPGLAGDPSAWQPRHWSVLRFRAAQLPLAKEVFARHEFSLDETAPGTREFIEVDWAGRDAGLLDRLVGDARANGLDLQLRPSSPPTPRASIFFVHPTSFLDSSAWNAPLTHEESQWRAGLFVQSQASTFNGVGRIWAPKYRQATFGAFLTDEADARRALDFAYKDVLAAYEQFIKEAPRDQPIILAGHSQGSFHLLRLLHERIRSSPERTRVAAAYLVGWPISTTVDLPQLPLPACERAGQAGCIISWSSFAEPADPAMIVDTWEASSGLDGQPRRGSAMLCVNPLTGNAGDAAGAEANRGTLIPNQDLTDGTILPARVPARCDARGFLLIGTDPPDMGPYVLPGNNYHVYDYTLFWSNLRADVEARLGTFLGR